MRKLFFLLLTVALVACGTTPAPVEEPQEEVQVETTTDTIQPDSALVQEAAVADSIVME